MNASSLSATSPLVEIPREIDRLLAQAESELRMIDAAYPTASYDRERAAESASNLRLANSLFLSLARAFPLIALLCPSIDRAFGLAGDLLVDLDNALRHAEECPVAATNRILSSMRRNLEDELATCCRMIYLGYLDKLLGQVREARHQVAAIDAVAVSDAYAVAPKLGQAAPSRIALGLMTRVVCVLPEEHQARYCEEYAAELADLATDGRSRWAQLSYVARLTSTVLPLRRVLRGLKQRPTVQRP